RALGGLSARNAAGWPHPHSRSRLRKRQFDLQPWRIVAHFDARAMKTGHRCDQTEAEAVARRVAALFKAIEALEDMLMLARRDTAPIVRDRNDRLAVNHLTGDDDLAAGAAVLERIVDEIGDGIEDQVAIARRHHLSIPYERQLRAILLRRSIIQFDDLAS